MPKLKLRRAFNMMMPEDDESAAAILSLDPTKVFDVNVRNKREPRRHRFLFAAIAIAYQAWPKQHPFQPDDTEHLRAWLLCEAEHCETTIVPVKRRKDLYAAAASLSAAMAETNSAQHRLIDSDGLSLRLRVPRSISYAACKEDAYFPVMMDVGRIIQSVTRLSIESLFAQAAAASGVKAPEVKDQAEAA